MQNPPALSRPRCGGAPGRPRRGLRGVDPGDGIDLFPFMRLVFIFLPPEPTPQASSVRASGPAQNRVAFGHFITPPSGGSLSRARNLVCHVAAGDSSISSVELTEPCDNATLREHEPEAAHSQCNRRRVAV